MQLMSSESLIIPHQQPSSRALSSILSSHGVITFTVAPPSTKEFSEQQSNSRWLFWLHFTRDRSKTIPRPTLINYRIAQSFVPSTDSSHSARICVSNYYCLATPRRSNEWVPESNTKGQQQQPWWGIKTAAVPLGLGFFSCNRPLLVK